MSLLATKVQRYAVTFKTRLCYVNASTEHEALATVRTKLIAEAARKAEDHVKAGKVAPPIDEDLATYGQFALVARAKTSLRY